MNSYNVHFSINDFWNCSADAYSALALDLAVLQAKHTILQAPEQASRVKYTNSIERKKEYRKWAAISVGKFQYSHPEEQIRVVHGCFSSPQICAWPPPPKNFVKRVAKCLKAFNAIIAKLTLNSFTNCLALILVSIYAPLALVFICRLHTLKTR